MRRALVRCILLLAIFLPPGGCGPAPSAQEEPETISREAFIRTYVALRTAALGSPEGVIRVEDRDRILREMGVREEDLLEFAEVRGEDLAFMAGVWQELDSIMRDLRTDPEGGRGREEAG